MNQSRQTSFNSLRAGVRNLLATPARLLCLGVVLLASSAPAFTVRMWFVNPYTGTNYTNAIIVTPISTNILASGGVQTTGVPLRLTPGTNGFVTNYLGQGFYAMQGTGANLGAVVLNVYDNGAQATDYTNLLYSGFNTYAIVYGSNQPPSSGQITNALGFLPVSPTKLDQTNAAILQTVTNAIAGATSGSASVSYVNAALAATNTALTNLILATTNGLNTRLLGTNTALVSLITTASNNLQSQITAGGSATNAIALLNGKGTNTTLYGLTLGSAANGGGFQLTNLGGIRSATNASFDIIAADVGNNVIASNTTVAAAASGGSAGMGGSLVLRAGTSLDGAGGNVLISSGGGGTHNGSIYIYSPTSNGGTDGTNFFNKSPTTSYTARWNEFYGTNYFTQQVGIGTNNPGTNMLRVFGNGEFVSLTLGGSPLTNNPWTPGAATNGFTAIVYSNASQFATGTQLTGATNAVTTNTAALLTGATNQVTTNTAALLTGATNRVFTNLTANYIAADTVVSNGAVAAAVAADTVNLNRILGSNYVTRAGAISALATNNTVYTGTNTFGVNAAFSDGINVSGTVSADTLASDDLAIANSAFLNGGFTAPAGTFTNFITVKGFTFSNNVPTTNAMVAADTVVSNGAVAAAIAADTVNLNRILGSNYVTASVTNGLATALSDSQKVTTNQFAATNTAKLNITNGTAYNLYSATPLFVKADGNTGVTVTNDSGGFIAIKFKSSVPVLAGDGSNAFGLLAGPDSTYRVDFQPSGNVDFPRDVYAKGNLVSPAITATNTLSLSNLVVLSNTTSVVSVRNATTPASANGTYNQVSATLYTNRATGSYYTNNTGTTWTVFNSAGAAQFNRSGGPTGALTAAGGTGSPSAEYGQDVFADGFNFKGAIASTNLDERFAQKAGTNILATFYTTNNGTVVSNAISAAAASTITNYTSTNAFLTKTNPTVVGTLTATNINGVKTYRALLTQTGTNAPTATVLENTLGGTPVYTRDDVGTYFATLTNSFPTNKTFISIGSTMTGDSTINSSYIVEIQQASATDSKIVISSGIIGGGGSDDLLLRTPLQVLVYP